MGRQLTVRHLTRLPVVVGPVPVQCRGPATISRDSLLRVRPGHQGSGPPPLATMPVPSPTPRHIALRHPMSLVRSVTASPLRCRPPAVMWLACPNLCRLEDLIRTMNPASSGHLTHTCQRSRRRRSFSVRPTTLSQNSPDRRLTRTRRQKQPAASPPVAHGGKNRVPAPTRMVRTSSRRPNSSCL